VWVRPREQKVVGAALAALRQRMVVTQAALARRLGKPQSFVSSYETGQRRIDLLEFLRIVEALDGNPRAVFSDIVRKRVRRVA